MDCETKKCVDTKKVFETALNKFSRMIQNRQERLNANPVKNGAILLDNLKTAFAEFDNMVKDFREMYEDYEPCKEGYSEENDFKNQIIEQHKKVQCCACEFDDCFKQ